MSWLSALFQRRVVGPIVTQLRQGSDPRGLALSCAAGVVCGLFPILGATSLLGLVAGSAFKLNHPVIQGVNYLMSPVQLLLIPVFGISGHLLLAPAGEPLPELNPVIVAGELAGGVVPFLKTYGLVGLRAVLVWILVMPFVAILTRNLALPPIARLHARFTESR